MDTIAAISTATGPGGIGIVRLSGEDALTIGEKIFQGIGQKGLNLEENRTLQYGHIVRDGQVLDEVLIAPMAGPKTYTREDMLEIYCHGGRIALGRVLDYCLDSGARLAEAGEFTRRAFLNGRLDLSQAEAVVDLIESKSQEAYDQSLLQLEGALGEAFQGMEDQLMELSGLIVANIDFPEDDIEELNREKFLDRAQDLQESIQGLIKTAGRGKMLRDGIKTVIVGKPNVGKSSLLNLLLGQDRAIVTDIPGTTRDSIEEYINLDDLVLHMIDTAGIRSTEDAVEKIGVERSLAAMDQADLVLALFDRSQSFDGEDEKLLDRLEGRKVLYLVNKSDLPGGQNKEDLDDFFKDRPYLLLSVLKKEGIASLEEKIKEICYEGDLGGSDLTITNLRQLNVLKRVKKSVDAIYEGVLAGVPMDCIEVDLRDALDSIGEITGKTVTEDILDRIFHEFCIGK